MVDLPLFGAPARTSRAFPAEIEAEPGAAFLPGGSELLPPQTREAALQIGVEVIGAFVFRQSRDHVLEPLDLFVDGPGVPKSVLGLPVFRRDVRRHVRGSL